MAYSAVGYMQSTPLFYLLAGVQHLGKGHGEEQ